MTLLDCEAVRGRLDAFHDGELSLEEQVYVETHIDVCPRCAAEVDDMRRVRGWLRQGLRGLGRVDESLQGWRAGIATRAVAEYRESFRVRVRQWFEDLHLVWAALAASSAVLVCALGAWAVWYPAGSVRADSLSGLVAALAAPTPPPVAAPPGLRIQVPYVASSPDLPSMFDSTGPDEGDLVFALAAMVTREGRMTRPEVLLTNQGARQVFLSLVEGVQLARLEPRNNDARSQIAVNLVWILAHTTVRAKALS